MTDRPKEPGGRSGRSRRLGLAAAGVLALAAVGLAWRAASEELAVRANATAARRLIGAGDYQGARPPLDRWLKARPKSAEAAFLLARVVLELGMIDVGFQVLDRAAALGHPPDLVDRERALALSRLGRHAEALPILRRLEARADGPDPAADEALARCYLESFQLKDAARVLARWSRASPRDPRPYLWRARAGRKSNATMDSLAGDYEQVLRLDPSCAEARIELAELYLTGHRLDEARTLYAEQLGRSPDDPKAHVGMGRILAERGDEPAAIEHLDRATTLAPRDPRARIERARIDLGRGALDSALRWLDEALKLDDSEVDAHYLRGLVLTGAGRDAEARVERERTARLRRDQEEITGILQALDNSPRDVKLQHDAASWLFGHGHPEEGLHWALKILREHPSHPETNRLLADHYRRQGNPGLAQFYQLQGGTGPLPDGPSAH